MYAIFKLGEKQYLAEEGKILTIDLLDKETGAIFESDQVLLLKSAANETQIGTPTIEGAKITATVVEHFKDKKIVVFKKKRRKGYRRTQGHRQRYTKIKVDKILA